MNKKKLLWRIFRLVDDTFSHSPFIGCDNNNVFYNVNEFNYKIVQSKSEIKIPFFTPWWVFNVTLLASD